MIEWLIFGHNFGYQDQGLLTIHDHDWLQLIIFICQDFKKSLLYWPNTPLLPSGGRKQVRMLRISWNHRVQDRKWKLQDHQCPSPLIWEGADLGRSTFSKSKTFRLSWTLQLPTNHRLIGENLGFLSIEVQLEESWWNLLTSEHWPNFQASCSDTGVLPKKMDGIKKNSSMSSQIIV